MTKFILKEKIPNTSYEVGHVFETDKYDRLVGNVWIKDFRPHEILMMTKLGILEEVKEKLNTSNEEFMGKGTTDVKCSRCGQIGHNFCAEIPLFDSAETEIKDWRPKNNERYFYITSDENIVEDIWDNMPMDLRRKYFMGIFKTREDAEKALDEILVMLKKRK